MQPHATPDTAAVRRHRPKTLTVFAAAFVAGAVLAYGVNRVVDVHTVQVEPQVESEPIFVALRSLPQGAPVTVWDVALKDWPKAMLPTTALRADAALEGMVLRHPIREGQPLLSVQLVRDAGASAGTAIVAGPGGGPATPAADAMPPSRSPLPAVAAVVPVTEQFVPATPAEPVGTPPADVVPHAAVPAISPATVAAEPAAVDPVPPAAVGTAPVATTTTPRSTDVDEPAPVPVVAEPTRVVAADMEPVPLPVAASVPEAVPTPTLAPAVAAVSDAPLAAPVPALPSTDIGRSLAEFGRAHQPEVREPQVADESRHEQPASVLDRTTEAEPPTAARPAQKYHLVVPERIALAVDASFTQQPQPPETAAPAAVTDQPSRDDRPADAQARSTGPRQPATNPAGRTKSAVQPQRHQPAGRPQAAPTTRGFSAWMPKFFGDSRQR